MHYAILPNTFYFVMLAFSPNAVSPVVLLVIDRPLFVCHVLILSLSGVHFIPTAALSRFHISVCPLQYHNFQ